MIIAVVYVYALAAANWTEFYLEHRPQIQNECSAQWHPPCERQP